MSENLFSVSWYRVAILKPQIREHAHFHRHLYRGDLWYVLQDRSNGRCHRLTPSAYQLVGLMDGERTIQEIWELSYERLGEDGPTQDEAIRLLGLLHFADVLRCDVPPDTVELFRRQQRRSEGEWWRRFTNPLSLKFPLFDPDEFLARTLHLVRPLFSWPAATIWLLLVGWAIAVAGSRWSELTEGINSEMLDPRSVMLFAILYPAVKIVHELGHAYATKLWGGEVRETGIMVLVLMPIPYVDASSASVFPSKWRRALVGAAGILVELFVTAVALLVWANVEPGLVRSIAWHVIWIAGVSTLLFNGNPLLRFDGYYVLSDLIEIPNLATRSRQYLSSLALRYVCRMERVRSPVTARGETAWFLCYGVASFIYRFVILFGIAIFVAGRFFVVGVVLALFAVTMQIVVPLLRQIAFLLTNPRLGEKRPQALAITGGIALVLAVLALLLPLPSRTRAEGVVWPPEGAEVRARADGFVLRVLAEPDELLEPGQPLILTRDPSLEAHVAVLEAKLREVRARHKSERGRERVKARITAEEVETIAAELEYARERVGEMVVRSPAAGVFVISQPIDLPGRFVRKGELIGYVLGEKIDSVRVVLPQADAALVRGRTENVEVRLQSRVDEVLAARIRREIPGATNRLPSRALGSGGGGRIAVNPADPEGLETLEPVFQLDLTLVESRSIREIGGRAHVRLDHGTEPLAAQAYRGLRRLFLRQLGV
ncbi:MAG: peptidase M50 [Myxococcales bacterium]|nr:peptidase M50 [Myxococcales bacterium]